MFSLPERDQVRGAWRAVRGRQLSPAAFRRITTVALAVMVLIIVSGAAVRLTGSGLGCPDWPSCTATHVVAPLGIHPWIEMANRLINAGIGVVAIVAVGGALVRVRRRRDLTWLSLGLIGGVLAEIVLGGITVLDKLAPSLVSAHFALAMLILANALVLRHRAAMPDEAVTGRPGRAIAGGERVLVVSPAQRWLSRLIVVAAGVVIMFGTVVTGTGPHGGSPLAPRYHLSLHTVAQRHGSAAEGFVGLVVILCWWLARSSVPRAVLIRAEVLLGITVAQGIVGYVQYATGVPTGLVEIHVIGAVALAIAVVQLHLGLTVRSSGSSSARPVAARAPLSVAG